MRKMTTRDIVTAGLLGAVCIILGATGLGMIPIPSIAGRATIMHVPVILAGVVQGPVVGAMTGAIMGIYSFLTPAGAIPADPIVRILPRILIGIVAAYSFRIFRKKPEVGAAVAGALGTITNTVGFMGLAILMGYLPWQAALTIVPQFLAEIILATLLVVVLVRVLKDRIHN